MRQQQTEMDDIITLREDSDVYRILARGTTVAFTEKSIY